MSGAFAAAASVLLSDLNLAEDLEWWPAGAPSGTAIRGMVRTPTAVEDFFGQTAARPAMIVEVSAGLGVARGDRIRRGGVFHPVRDVPLVNGNGTLARLALGPAGAT